MEKTYKCKNSHKFKRQEAANVTCPTCNESAEPVRWKEVGEFTNSSKNFGFKEAFGSIVGDIKDGFKK